MAALTSNPFPALLFVIMVSMLLFTSRIPASDMTGGVFERAVGMTELTESDEVELRYTLKLPSRAPRVVEVHQMLPAGFELPEVKSRRLLSREGSFTFRLRAPGRGIYRIPPYTVWIEDMAGITVRSGEFGMHTDIVVTSPVDRLDMGAIHPLHPKAVSGNRVSYFKGTGSEFYSLRSYVEGESVRRVNWRASARSYDIWVNEFLTESSGTQIIILDARIVEDDRNLSRELVDRGIRAAGSIAYSSLQERNAVGMFVLSAPSVIIRPDYGTRQFYRIRELLKSVGMSPYETPFKIRRMMDVYGDRKAQYIVISPLTDDETLESVADLALSHEDVTVLVPVTGAPQLVRDAEEMAITLSSLSQETNAAAMARICRTITWRRDEELAAAVSRARIMPRRRRL